MQMGINWTEVLFQLPTRCLHAPPDINECEVYGTCPQACKNTKGSYDCECAPGYRKVGNGNMCEAEGESTFLVKPCFRPTGVSS